MPLIYSLHSHLPPTFFPPQALRQFHQANDTIASHARGKLRFMRLILPLRLYNYKQFLYAGAGQISCFYRPPLSAQ